jgi:hypothetical protein
MVNPERFSFFPSPAEGETTYSWITRYHLMSGHASFRANTMALLGVLHGRASNEFPSFLPQLSVAADMPLSTIIHYMTPYQYYATFLPEKLRQMFREHLSTGQTRNLQSIMGTVANRMTPGQQMYSCRHCIREDIEQYGFPFWHLLHQLTGVVACSRHHELLHAVPRIKSQAMLPKLVIERPSKAMEDRYVSLIQEMHKLQNNMFSKQQCLLAYRRRLCEMEMLTTHHRIRFQQLRELIGSRLKGVEVGVGAFDYLKQQLSNNQFPECLFYQAHVNHHPLKHLVLIDVLFEDWHEFIVEVNKAYVPLEAKPVVISKPKRSIELSHKAQSLLRAGRSLRVVSKVVGISVSTLKILAQRAGILVDCRPSKVFPDIERSILRLLTLGEKTSGIAATFGISVGAVEQVLSKHPELVILRNKIWFHQRRKFHRSAILMHVEHNPSASRKLIRLALSASYIWLYKHDKSWLYEHLPPEIPRSERFQSKGII